MKKTEVIESIDPIKTYLGSFVRQKINEVTIEDRYLPKELKRGDVINVFHGIKKRPCVILSIKDEMVIHIPLTSSKNIHNLCESKSRFYGDGHFSNTYGICKLETALESFIGVYDNDLFLDNAEKELALFFIKNVMKIKANDIEEKIEVKPKRKRIVNLYEYMGVKYTSKELYNAFGIKPTNISMAFKNKKEAIIKGLKITKL
jgi:hypothetical protein